MYLVHWSTGNNLLKVLDDGYLKSSKTTKNVKLFGHKSGSKYIYLRLGRRNDNYGNLYFDKKLLLENIFYLQIGWNGEPITEKIDGRKLDENELDKLLKKFNEDINKNNKNNMNIPIFMNNEILLMKKISLKKYLRKIDVPIKNTKKIIDICKTNYPNVILK